MLETERERLNAFRTYVMSQATRLPARVMERLCELLDKDALEDFSFAGEEGSLHDLILWMGGPEDFENALFAAEMCLAEGVAEVKAAVQRTLEEAPEAFPQRAAYYLRLMLSRSEQSKALAGIAQALMGLHGEAAQDALRRLCQENMGWEERERLPFLRILLWRKAITSAEFKEAQKALAAYWERQAADDF